MKFLKVKRILTSNTKPIDNVIFPSVFQTFHRKNDHSIVLRSLNPEGPLGSYLCDVTLPALLITCQFSFRIKP